MWQEDRQFDNRRFGVLTYGAYVLAREKKAPLATLRQLYELRAQAHSGLALVQLGIALKLMGDEAKSATAIAEGLRKGRDSGYWWWDYGSPLRDAALSYALLERHRLAADGRETLVTVIAAEMENHRYYSTQEKLALFLVGRAYSSEPGGPWTATVSASGKPEEVAGKTTHFREVSAGELVNGIKIVNTHQERLYAELALSGNPVKQPAAKSAPIELKRSLHEPDGTVISGRTLKVGETVLVHVTARSDTSIGTGMIVDRIPAGLEIENLNIVQGEQMGTVTIANVNPATAMLDPRIKHVEFRDDRFVAAVRLDDNVLNLFYRARVVTPGKFVVPPLYAEDMYRPDLFGLTGGTDTLKVVDAKSDISPAQAKPADGVKAESKP